MRDEYERSDKRSTGAGVVLAIGLSLALAGVGTYYVHEKHIVDRAPIEAARLKAQAELDIEKMRADSAAEARKADAQIERLKADTQIAVARATAEAKERAHSQVSAAISWNEKKTAEAEATKASFDFERSKIELQTSDIREREKSRVKIYEICIAASNDPAVCAGQTVQTVRCLTSGGASGSVNDKHGVVSPTEKK